MLALELVPTASSKQCNWIYCLRDLCGYNSIRMFSNDLKSIESMEDSCMIAVRRSHALSDTLHMLSHVPHLM